MDSKTGQVRFALTDVCGGQGVECLQGSGEIAAATSRAYKSTVTLAYVTGRSVGIGAYCSRLCQRVIQHNDAPLILTGASALNKVLGREVYTSNAQIGGPKVMANNGVSHMVVPDDARREQHPAMAVLCPGEEGRASAVHPAEGRRVRHHPSACWVHLRECAARSEGDASALLRPWVVHGGDDGLGQERGHGQGTPSEGSPSAPSRLRRARARRLSPRIRRLRELKSRRRRRRVRFGSPTVRSRRLRPSGT